MISMLFLTDRSFPEEEVVDFKHLVYNLLVEAYNNPEQENLVMPISIIDKGNTIKNGFQFNERKNPDKLLVTVNIHEMLTFHSAGNLCKILKKGQPSK